MRNMKKLAATFALAVALSCSDSTGSDRVPDLDGIWIGNASTFTIQLTLDSEGDVVTGMGSITFPGGVDLVTVADGIYVFPVVAMTLQRVEMSPLLFRAILADANTMVVDEGVFLGGSLVMSRAAE